jgi:hypothetical protein
MKKAYLLLAIAIITCALNGNATLWTVGFDDYPSPNALYMADQEGEIEITDFDSIYIYEQIYYGTDALAAWEQNDLFIFSVLNGAQMEVSGEHILGKGIWVCVGDNITIENIGFIGAEVPDHNGAGIRLDGIGMTVRNCYFRHNENGILTSNPYDGNILVDHCEFAYNGYGDGFTHHIYVGHVNNFTLRHSYMTHAVVGHNVKSRANNTTIEYNFIADKETSTSSRLIDIPNGGTTVIKGNILMQGPAALNNNMVGYGLEGLSNPAPHEFLFVHNTMVNKREASCRFLQIAAGTEEAYVVNNIFGGTGDLVDGETTTFSHNIADEDLSVFEFESEPDYNYNIGSSSIAIDSGMVLTGDIIPEFEYAYDSFPEVPRALVGTRPDVGAFEYHYPIGYPEFEQANFVIYPNPSKGEFSIQHEGKIDFAQVLDLRGKVIFTTNNPSKSFTISAPSGTYILELKLGGEIVRELLILE